MKNINRINKSFLGKSISMLFCILTFTFTVSSHASSLKIGDMAPNFTVKTLGGVTVNLHDFINEKPVYLKFWATWCSYCKVEMPHLQAIYDENGKHVEVLTVNVGMNDSISNIDRYFRKNSFTIPTIFDQKGDLTSSFGVVGTPYHVLIDKQGKIDYRTFLATDLLDEKIAAWSKESKNATANERSIVNGRSE
jgi:thiol-disulfide isomerase/thioredoxin